MSQGPHCSLADVQARLADCRAALSDGDTDAVMTAAHAYTETVHSVDWSVITAGLDDQARRALRDAHAEIERRVATHAASLRRQATASRHYRDTTPAN